ncbi:MAG TPA: PadR family transcriptional regulator [Solirubrobacterales bacterium]
MSVTRLTETSYVVLGLIERLQPATAYDLKRAAENGVEYLWALPHTQLYSECARLAEAGLLDEEREETGRRRRIYRISRAGRRELAAWRDEPPAAGGWELRDPGLLKLFLGADPVRLAEDQIAAHEERLREYERMAAAASGPTDGTRLALEAGIGHEREYLRYWRRIADGRGADD